MGGKYVVSAAFPHKESIIREIKMKVLVATAVASAFLVSGCASILNDKTQQVNVSTSNGKSIKGTVNGVPFTAPGIVTLNRENQNKIFNVETEGCAKQTVAEKKVDLKFFINVLSGGVFGSTTDYATEKMWAYSDNIIISCSK